MKEENDDIAQIMENIDTERQGYPIDEIDDSEYNKLPRSLLSLAKKVEDVRADGNLWILRHPERITGQQYPS